MSGSSSGTYTWGLSNGGRVLEAFEDCGLSAPELTRRHMTSAYVSLNRELAEWSNRGVNLWKMSTQNTVNLVQGQPVYTLPANVVTLTDLWFTQVNGNGSGYNSDRIMVPITRDQYAMLPDKRQPGIPTQYWYERLSPASQFTIWQPSNYAAPGYVLTYNALLRIQDANITAAETPDVPYRALNALAAGLAARLALKFAPARFTLLKQLAMEAWDSFATNDQEPGPLIIAPNVAAYARL